MMKMLREKDFKSMPWRNGGGTTTEIFRDTPGEDFNLRLSIAKVEKDGEFSLFPNYRRHLLIIFGHGILLNKMFTLTQETESFTFSGNDSFYCNLINGPVLDFNIMINPKWGEAVLQKNNLNFKYDGDLNFIYAIDSKVIFIFEADENPENKSTNFVSIKIKRAS